MTSATKTILVVDDESDVRLLCKVNLEFEGFHVLEASSGEQAMIRLTDSMVDLVLLDVMMPGMDGWEVLQAMKDSETANHIPVVMLTAKVQDKDQVRSYADGAFDHVSKPFNPIALGRTVRSALEIRGVGEIDQKRNQMLGKLKLAEGLDS
ncbi:MAG: response regulator [Actinomycetota bacterium]